MTFSKLVLKNFKIDDRTEFPSAFRVPLIFVEDSADPGDIDNLASPIGSLIPCDSGVIDDIRVALCIMCTLHLLAVKSWNHLGILPNRLRINRRLS